MTISFTRTRTQIAQRVLGKVIKIGTTTMEPADEETVYEAIDLRLKELHKLGLFWRKVTTVPVTFSLDAGVASASAGAGDILFPVKVTFKNGDQDDPVYIIGPTEYAGIPQKTNEGVPSKVLWKGGSEFLFHPIPSANGTAKLLYEKIIDDTSAGAAIDIDVSMIRAMIDIIKYDVADDFGIDEQIQSRWRAEADRAQIDIRKLGNPKTDYLPVAVDDFDGKADKTRPSGGYLNNDYVE